VKQIIEHLKYAFLSNFDYILWLNDFRYICKNIGKNVLRKEDFCGDVNYSAQPFILIFFLLWPSLKLYHSKRTGLAM
jgi:hypothetical protein